MSLIYEPKGRAREYAALACNIYRGCSHGCTYCYAPNALHMDRNEFYNDPRARGESFIRQLAIDAAKIEPSEPVLLCFSCDPYQPLDEELQLTRATIQVLHAAGHSVTVLTKGGTRALRDLDLFTPKDAFATTLTMDADCCSTSWEPGAALPSDRMMAIDVFNEAGIPTWVSLEPVLDPETALRIIRGTYRSVDLYKVGRWNYDARANAIDWAKFAADVVALLGSLGKDYIIKRDLACFLPEGTASRAERSGE